MAPPARTGKDRSQARATDPYYAGAMVRDAAEYRTPSSASGSRTRRSTTSPTKSGRCCGRAGEPPPLITQAGAMSRPILERLGFRRVGRTDMLVDDFGSDASV
jgi:hypothetical protein